MWTFPLKNPHGIVYQIQNRPRDLSTVFSEGMSFLPIFFFTRPNIIFIEYIFLTVFRYVAEKFWDPNKYRNRSEKISHTSLGKFQRFQLTGRELIGAMETAEQVMKRDLGSNMQCLIIFWDIFYISLISNVAFRTMTTTIPLSFV